jgi:hypothetical protein
MRPDRKIAFYWRAFVTFYVILSFVVIAASGLVLFISPPGRVANWSQWTFGGLQKANWRVTLNYLRRKVGEGLHRGKEMGLAVNEHRGRDGPGATAPGGVYRRHSGE